MKTTEINNRRYLGNKYRLLPFIVQTIKDNCETISSFADLFAGTGAVSSAFAEKTLITNDILYSNYICNLAWFGAQEFNPEIVKTFVEKYNNLTSAPENYMTHNFADTFFSADNCSKIGYVREDIEQNFTKQNINERERALLITSLLYAMDKIANTCGHYDAYRKGVSLNKTLELAYPNASLHNNPLNKCYNQDINILASNIEADLVYLDPPYNSRQYSDAYHLLENVARWQKPEVKGVARKMDRSALKSNFCTSAATAAFERLIGQLRCRYIVLSYNNMSNKGNDRSNAKISDTDILRILQSKGSVQVFSQQHKAFTTGKSSIADNEERLFLCVCKR